jgi:3-methyl-2-oxobutanoate hydroxymethyltransferase
VSRNELNFAAEHCRLQEERLAAFREYIVDAHEGYFPKRSHLVEFEAAFLDEMVCSIGGAG